jgi:excisionase family DNA binding protein
MIRIKDVAAMFGVSRSTVYKWMKEGMPHVHVGKLLFFQASALEAWVFSHGN